MTDTRLRTAISDFLDSFAANQAAFEQQAAFSTSAEAQEAGAHLWATFAELHRAVGREPPGWPAQFSQNSGSLI